ncbi:hypothetical protein [Streptomyces scabiei]|uniref:hypothetical protein n=1 Tax=Streptomyces scabiei TaxID=1930 RepID=UPI001FF6D0CD|nr:hypothetical protein [Streptomyces sp. LBUM 1481]
MRQLLKELLLCTASAEEASIMPVPAIRIGERKTTPMPAASAFNRSGSLAGQGFRAWVGGETS